MSKEQVSTAEYRDEIAEADAAIIDAIAMRMEIADELAKASVTALIVEQFKGKKQLVFKFKKRKGYKKLNGHRQKLTRLFISSITGADGKVVEAEIKGHDKAEEKAEEPEVVEPEVVEAVEAVEEEQAE